VLEVGREPQLFVDDHLVDNRWGIEHRTQTVARRFHAPRKDPLNPLIPGKGGYVNVARDERTGRFQMWYQEFWRQSPTRYTYGIAYAESDDGLRWKLPRIGKYEFKGTRDNNIVLLGPGNSRAETQWLVEAAPEDRRGYRYILLYNTDARGARGLHLIGSIDGIEWDPASDVRIAADYTPDTHTSIVWDPRRRTYVAFTRATNIYREHGPRRKVARLEHARLWESWPLYPENVLLPDEADAATAHNYFYGMPVRYYGGLYWGFLWPYRAGEDITTELAFSRDGRDFHRLPGRPRLIGLGPGGAWDDGMVLGSGWLEVGDEWWIYYSGADGPHASGLDPTTGMGLARVRKEGFVSLGSPAGGGVIVTRMLRWPGGRLEVNADAAKGGLTVRVLDYDLRPLPEFSAEPSLPIAGDRVRHEVVWRGADLGRLEGRAIRLEFTMKGVVDLYAFQATADPRRP
jgi:hypothetical protein